MACTLYDKIHAAQKEQRTRHIYGARNQQSCNYKIVSGRKYHNRWNLIFAGDDIRNIFISGAHNDHHAYF